MKDFEDSSAARKAPAQVDLENDEFAPTEPLKKVNPLLAKIQNTIAQTDPEKWERHGDDLNPEGKYQKARETWEVVCCITIPAGILAFRSSQPVISQYFGGGYTIAPAAPERYSVELRPRAWNPKTLVDPFFRNVLEKDKEFKLLADGEVAKTVYLQIEETLRSYSGERTREAKLQLEEFMRNIDAKIAESNPATWKKSRPDLETTQFDAELEGVKVSVSYGRKDGIDQYRLKFTKSRAVIKSNDAVLAKKLFEDVTYKLENAALEALDSVLDGVDL